MKRILFIFIVFLGFCLWILSCNLGAQEGCGYWLKTKGLLNIEDFLLRIDSVWIPKPCPAETLDMITLTQELSGYRAYPCPVETVWVPIPCKPCNSRMDRIDSLESGLLPALFCTTYTEQETTAIRIDIELLLQKKMGDSTWRWNPKIHKFKKD